jgi:hypothetical protein
VFIRKKKHHHGGSAYFQLVESRRVDGQPRQKVVLHLGGHATVNDALKEWPREVSLLRRHGYPDAADNLKAKLDRLKELRAEGVV